MTFAVPLVFFLTSPKLAESTVYHVLSREARVRETDSRSRRQKVTGAGAGAKVSKKGPTPQPWFLPVPVLRVSAVAQVVSHPYLLMITCIRNLFCIDEARLLFLEYFCVSADSFVLVFSNKAIYGQFSSLI